MNVEAVAASIAHEIKQPLAAIVMNGGAALQFLGNAPLITMKSGQLLNDIITDGHRTSEVFEGIRALFRKVDQEQQAD